MKKKIALIGGCGFIGHNLALKLKSLNYDVSIVDSLSINNLYSTSDTEIKNKKLYISILKNRIDIIKRHNIELIVQDARDYNAMSKIIFNINPDIIVHLAAVSHANKSNKDPHSTFDHSLRTLENTLDIARNNKTHVIYTSSSMVYGNFKTDKVDEETECKPIGIYGSLKLSGELLVKAYNQVFNLPYTIIRPSALYGERCVSRRVGQIFIENSLTTKKITINGSGEEKLDFTYIEDLINGIILCCENKNALNQTFNLTFGQSKRILDLLDILKEEFPDISVEFFKKEALMPERGTLNVSKAKKLINYNPSNELKIGFKKYINWYKNFWASINNK
jgi:nucleoside-diphosphate-sugar epimerase